MEDLVTLFMNAGVTIVVLAYFMLINYKFMGKLETTLQVLVDTVNTLKDSIDDKKED